MTGEARQAESRLVRRPSHALVGREIEIRTVVDLLEGGSARLVTVAGAAGVGKSVVADEALRRLMAREPLPLRRLVLPETSPVRGWEPLVSDALAGGTAGASVGPPPPGRRRVVVLDGIGAAPEVARAVAAALDADPNLIVLTTSVTPLRLVGEEVVRLGPLPLPPLGTGDPDRAAASPAVRLFCEEVASRREGFCLTPSNTSDVVELCIRLDGLPLALELAASRCEALSVHDVLDLYRAAGPIALTVETFDVAAHHRSLHDTIDWTVGLLEPAEVALLAPLAVFAGPFDMEALRAVVRPQDDRPPTSVVVLANRLGTLVATGLVRPLPESGRSPGSRYLMSDAVRTYALEHLHVGGVLGALRWRHIEHYRLRAHRAAARRWTWGGAALARGLIEDRSEYLAVLDLLDTDGDVVDALSLAVDLEGLWLSTGAAVGAHHVQELLERARRTAAWNREDQAELTSRALTCLVLLSVWSRQPALGSVAREWLAEALALSRGLERPDLVLQAMCAEVQLLVVEGKPEAGLATAERALDESLARADDYWRMKVLSWRAVAANNAGDPQSALDDAIAARDLARAAADEDELLLTSHVLRSITVGGRDPRAEMPDPDDLLELAREVEDERTEGMVLVGAALRCAATRDDRRAARFVLDTLELARRTDASYLEEMALLALVGSAVSARQLDAAIRLHGALLGVLPAVRAFLDPRTIGMYDLRVAEARAGLGEGAFDRIVARGRLLSWSGALIAARALARQLAGEPSVRARASDAPDPGGSVAAKGDAGLLSRRELEVLRLLASGCSNKQMAATLGLKPKTVMHYVGSICHKLEVKNRAEAVSEGWRRGVLDVADHAPPARPERSGHGDERRDDAQQMWARPDAREPPAGALPSVSADQ
jgi:predicted ATPase/DNA-binding CsgD family transcriptional regulator